MKWVASATAILTLAFALQRLVTGVSDAREKRHRIAEQLRTATIEREGGHYSQAWDDLQQAARLDANRADVRHAQEDLAMEWLRRIRVQEGKQTFTDIVNQLEPVLVRGLATSVGQRQADLTAHLGWADFLLWRDGQVRLSPEDWYRRALAADSANPYAHAMWAHWILWQHGSLAEARAIFASAVRSGRARAYVRELQIAALSSIDDSTGAELFRVANEMRAGNEPVSDETRWTVAGRLCVGGATYLTPSGPPRPPGPPVVSAEADTLTLEWLFRGLTLSDYNAAKPDYCRARLAEGAGQRARALALYKSVLTRLPEINVLRDDAEAAVHRLASSVR